MWLERRLSFARGAARGHRRDRTNFLKVKASASRCVFTAARDWRHSTLNTCHYVRERTERGFTMRTQERRRRLKHKQRTCEHREESCSISCPLSSSPDHRRLLFPPVFITVLPNKASSFTLVTAVRRKHSQNKNVQQQTDELQTSVSTDER